MGGKSRKSSLFVTASVQIFPTWLLIILQAASGVLVSLAIVKAVPGWMTWFSLTPFFLAPTSGLVALSAWCGATWGLSAFGAMSVLDPTHHLFADGIPFVLFISVPTIYASLIALISRRFGGFNPLLAGLAWVGLELALQPAGLPLGMLAGPQIENEILRSLAPVLGYALVSFVVATVNAYVAKQLAKLAAAPTRRSVRPGPGFFRTAHLLRRLPVVVSLRIPRRQRAPPQLSTSTAK